ncbi:MAG: hypothetical protein ACFCVE_00450 [Phycisphaerae bacterium]
MPDAAEQKLPKEEPAFTPASLATLVGVPVLLGVFLRSSYDGVARAVLWYAAPAAALVLLAVCLLARRRGRVRLLGELLLPTAMLAAVAAMLAWNRLHHWLKDAQGLNHEVFRPAFDRPWAPLYARVGDSPPAAWAGVILATAVAVAAVSRWPVHRRPTVGRWSAAACGFVALAAIFAASERTAEGAVRLTSHTPHHDLFLQDRPHFAGLADVLPNYVQRMPQLQWFGAHYPPGNLLLLWAERNWGITGAVWWLSVGGTAAGVFFVLLIGRDLGFSPAQRNASGLLYLSTGGLLTYATINTTALLALPAAAAAWCFLRAAGGTTRTPARVARGYGRKGDIRCIGFGVGLGFVMALFAMLSFSVTVFGLLLAVWGVAGVLSGRLSAAAVLQAVGVSLATFVLLLAGLWSGTGFNWLASLHTAVTAHDAQQAGSAFAHPLRWFVRSSGNLLAYGVSVLPVAVLAAAAAARARLQWRQDAALSVAAVATLVFVSFSGLFYMETERVFAFFTPVLAVAGGGLLGGRFCQPGNPHVVRLYAVTALILAATAELLLLHHL